MEMNFRAFLLVLPREGQGVATEIAKIARLSAIPDDHSIYDPMESFNLKEIFNSTFESYVSRIQGK